MKEKNKEIRDDKTKLKGKHNITKPYLYFLRALDVQHPPIEDG